MTHKDAIAEIKANWPTPRTAENGRHQDALTMACIALLAGHHVLRLGDEVERLNRENAALLRDASHRYHIEAEQAARGVFAEWRRTHAPNLSNRAIDAFEKGLNQTLVVLDAGVSVMATARVMVDTEQRERT